MIPEGFRISGENAFAKHSIHYCDLTSYFYVFTVWDNNNTALSWTETKEWCQLLGLQTVPTIYEGIFDAQKVHDAFTKHEGRKKDPVEGYVIRLRDSFSYDEYALCTAKYVRKGHVQTDQFWMTKPVIPNKLREQ
jgi:hypothetical protein